MASKRKHVTLTLEKKAEILRQLESGCSFTSLAVRFNVGKSTISDIKKKKNEILRYVSRTEKGPGTRKTMRNAEFSDVEDAVYTWFLQQRARHAPISEAIILQKARQFFTEMNYGEGVNFEASRGWFQGFKHRFGIRSLKVTGEKLSSDENAVEPFRIKLKQKIEQLGLSLEQIYNADESGLYWRCLPEKTLVHADEKGAPGRKISKDRITFMPCANASGRHKLRLLVIGKSKNPRPFKNIQLPVYYRNQKSAWVNQAIFKEWFHNEFVPSVKKHLRNSNFEEKALLVLDNASAHRPDQELASHDGNIQVMFLPPNCTALIQPMDQNVIQNVKVTYRKRLLQEVLLQEDENIARCLKNVSLKDAVFALAESWKQVPEKLVKKSWCQLLSAKNMDEWDEEDLIPLSDLREGPDRGPDLVELVNRVNRADDPIDKTEVKNGQEVMMRKIWI